MEILMNSKHSQVFSLPTNEPEIMYLIILFVFTATLNLSPNNSFSYNYEESPNGTLQEI